MVHHRIESGHLFAIQQVKFWQFGFQTMSIHFLARCAYSAESGHRFRANPATPRSPATQGLSARPSVADFR
ncbi:MAG: hypothetical protein OEW20_08410, partial [Nitrospira sp.]|nr:hypothetical protein [Nitrospira sp.]